MRNIQRFFLSLSCLGVLTGTSGAASLEILKERERKVKAIVSEVMPSVVAVVGTKQGAAGSGVIVSEDGLIMTAGHVTQAAGEELTIIFPDGRSVKGKSLGSHFHFDPARDKNFDTGLVQITEAGKWPYVKMGDSEEAELGDWVVAMGHPGGYDLHRSPPIRLGRLLSLGKMGMLETDCTLVGGDSGGPLFNLEGEVIGIHSSIDPSDLTENRHIPSAVFRKDWDRLMAGENWGNRGRDMEWGNREFRIDPDRPMLGVQMSEEESRVVISGLLPNSPAMRSGLKEGDIILEVDEIKSEQMSDVVDYVSSRKPGDKVELLVLRGGDERKFSVELARWEDLAGEMGRRERIPPEPEPAGDRPQLGVILDAEAAGAGAKIHEVMEGSLASVAGVLAGDVVIAINGDAVDSAPAMARLFRTYGPGEKLEITIKRGDEQKILKVELDGR